MKLLWYEMYIWTVSIYKRGAVEIFKNIGDENDNLLININAYEIIRIWDRYTGSLSLNTALSSLFESSFIEHMA